MRRPPYLAITVLCLASILSSAADWPQWRYDAGRSGYSPDALPAELELHWTRELPKPQVAWPTEARKQFDATYEPVVAGRTLFVGSPNDGSVRAFDTETGEQEWQFYTDGPVRFAPVAANGKVYAASDDGRLYCLDAGTGQPRWTFRAAPSDRPDLRHIGNNRLVSCWALRGGPVLVGDTIFVASGIWPIMGTFVYAVDANTGKVRWCNDRAHRISGVRVDHLGVQDAGIAPQGYLACEKGRLVVPNGRSLPAGFDATTGKLLWFCQGGRNGHWRVATRGGYAFVGNSGVVNTEHGRELGSSFYFRHDPGGGRWTKYFLAEAPKLAYEIMPGVSSCSVFAGQAVFGIHKGTLYAYDLRSAKLVPYETTVRGEKAKPNRWELDELWNLATGHTARGRALIGAGERLYGHTGNVLFAAHIPEGRRRPRLAWKKQLPGKPTAMAAADNRLFVVCDRSRILCFGPGAKASKTWEQAADPLATPDDEWTVAAADILRQTKTQDGYCLVLGLASGRLVEEILTQSRLRVIAADASSTEIDDLRDRMVAAGLYGERVEAVVADPLALSLAPCIASLIVSERYTAKDLTDEATARLHGRLRPYGGTICLRDDLGGWALERRTGPIPGSFDWTHGCADAARTYFSKDDNVKLPLAVLWYGEGEDHGFHKANDYGSGSKPQVAAGRLFAFRVRDHTLHALDVYTGRKLWQKTVAAFTRYASMPDGIYVAEGNRCTVCNPATGEALKTYPYAVEGLKELFVGDIRVDRDIIVIGVAAQKKRSILAGLWDSTVLIGLDRTTGKQLWVHRAKERFNIHGLAMGEGMVFCADSASVAKTGDMQRRGDPPKTLAVTLKVLDARTGQARWQQDREVPFMTHRHFGSMRNYDDWVAYAAASGVVLAGKHQRIFGFEAATGRVLWQAKGNLPQPTIIRGQELIPQTGVIYDVRSGKATGKRAFAYRGYGCNYGVGGKHLFTKRAGSMTLFDVATNRMVKPVPTRSGCSHSAIAAGGVLTVANFMDHCVCNWPVQTSYALFHLPAAAGWYGDATLEEPLRTTIAAAERAKAAKPSKASKAKATPKPPPPNMRVLVPAGAIWRYLDDGSDPGKAWIASDFDDRAWRSGPAQLGYGDRDEATKLSFGTNPRQKHLAYYFRHEFSVKEPAHFGKLLVRLIRDDGAVVYLNGAELVRSSMPEGPIGPKTSARFCGGSENRWVEAKAAATLKTGRNVLAVEVHQAGPTSSDISFDLQLLGELRRK